MSITMYSTYEAKARFSELMRKVRAGQRVTITYHGQEVAEVRPVATASASLEDRLRELEERGVLKVAAGPRRSLSKATPRPGALARFLESRD